MERIKSLKNIIELVTSDPFNGISSDSKHDTKESHGLL
jgi:hypothetical protein